MEILNNIIFILKQKGKKQIDLCNYLGINKTAFSSWKSGKNTSYKKYLPEIATFLDVSVEELLGTETKKEPVAISDRFNLDYNALDIEDRAKVDGFIAGLLSQDKYKKANAG